MFWFFAPPPYEHLFIQLRYLLNFAVVLYGSSHPIPIVSEGTPCGWRYHALLAAKRNSPGRMSQRPSGPLGARA